MNFDHVAIWVMQKNLMPTGNSPAAVVGVADAELIALAHEPLDVVRAEAEMSMPHRVHELLHLKSGLQVAFRPVKFNVSIGQEVDLSGVGAILAIATDDGVRLVIDRSQLEQRLVELGEPGQVVSTQVHVMELEIHVEPLLDGAYEQMT